MKTPFLTEYLSPASSYALLKHAEDVATSAANVGAQEAETEPAPAQPQGWDRAKRLAAAGARPVLGLGAGMALGAGGAALGHKLYQSATGKSLSPGVLLPAAAVLGAGGALANQYVMGKLWPKDVISADQGDTESVR